MMPRPKLQAVFFASADGIITPKAPILQEAQRWKIFERDGRACKSCGAEVKFGGNQVSPFQAKKSGHVDHIFPRARGGGNDDSNLRLLCMSCNSSKGAD